VFVGVGVGGKQDVPHEVVDFSIFKQSVVLYGGSVGQALKPGYESEFSIAHFVLPLPPIPGVIVIVCGVPSHSI
jgi:hypothetical protein